MSNLEVCVLKTDGINCDEEMANAFQVAGATPETVHINQLRSGERQLDQYGILAIPGGFSYGDDIASGKVLATELTSYLSDQLQDFVDKGKPVIGICNGFQVLVRTGLLPNRKLNEQQVTLADNEVGRFECRWIDLAVGRSACKFVSPEDFAEQPIPMQTAHGEGRFFGGEDDIRELKENGQFVFRYTTPDLGQPSGYPENPNGAVDDIAGICDPSGLVLGMMPHPERSVAAFHPHRVRTEAARNAANTIFSNIVTYAKEM
ncbi:MAG: phosphoribosylformylglycinamidine synthase I [Candidatus Nomurabacteria bacterium]|nr:MAG: phosphoribosylformylglycinamidine synthase I [Candidatus Nomurabacteria bacterium]